MTKWKRYQSHSRTRIPEHCMSFSCSRSAKKGILRPFSCPGNTCAHPFESECSYRPSALVRRRGCAPKLGQTPGLGAQHLTAISADATTARTPELLHLALRRRLRRPLPLTQAQCGGWLDAALCLNTHGSKLCTRQLAPKAALCRSNGSRTPQHPGLRQRVGDGFPRSWRHAAICCAATLVCRCELQGRASFRGSSRRDGAVREVALRRRLARYPEPSRDTPQQLCVVAVENGRRWTGDSHSLLQRLAQLRAKRAPPALRAAAAHRGARRWWGSWKNGAFLFQTSWASPADFLPSQPHSCQAHCRFDLPSPGLAEHGVRQLWCCQRLSSG